VTRDHTHRCSDYPFVYCHTLDKNIAVRMRSAPNVGYSQAADGWAFDWYSLFFGNALAMSQYCKWDGRRVDVLGGQALAVKMGACFGKTRFQP
jgi:hypothetical protein